MISNSVVADENIDASQVDVINNRKDISHTRTRYLVLILACFLCFGNYFIYGIPSALQTQIQDVI